MKNKWTKAAVIGLIAVLVVSLGAIAVFAQDDAAPEAPTNPAVPFGRGSHHGRGGFHGRAHGGANDEALAGALGITVEELQAAKEKAAAARLAQAVEDDYLTQEQVDNMLAMQALKEYIDQKALLAQALGLDADELEAALEDGSLRELLAGFTPAELQENMRTAVDAALQQAVADEVITQEQADLVSEQMENGFGMRGKFGGHHDFQDGPGRFHGYRGAPQDNDVDGSFGPFRSLQNAPAFDA